MDKKNKHIVITVTTGVILVASIVASWSFLGDEPENIPVASPKASDNIPMPTPYTIIPIPDSVSENVETFTLAGTVVEISEDTVAVTGMLSYVNMNDERNLYEGTFEITIPFDVELTRLITMLAGDPVEEFSPEIITQTGDFNDIIQGRPVQITVRIVEGVHTSYEAELIEYFGVISEKE